MTDLSGNRTGIHASPGLAEEMKQSARLTEVTGAQSLRKDFIREGIIRFGGPLGSLPEPVDGERLARFSVRSEETDSAARKRHDQRLQLLVNKLGQRLAFERAGARLYDALIAKCEAVADEETLSVVSLELLRQFREEEVDHFGLLTAVVEKLGLDPTAVTPDADAAGMAALGLTKVLSEPRTTVLQCLEAVQTAELTDNVAWGLLRELCLELELTEIADEFGRALAQEEIHAEMISEWIYELTLKRKMHSTR